MNPPPSPPGAQHPPRVEIILDSYDNPTVLSPDEYVLYVKKSGIRPIIPFISEAEHSALISQAAAEARAGLRIEVQHAFLTGLRDAQRNPVVLQAMIDGADEEYRKLLKELKAARTPEGANE